MKIRQTAFICGVLGGCLAAPYLVAAEWSRWRGPTGNSISDEAITLTPWSSQGPQRLWTNLVGTGFSSIAVSQGRLFTLGNSNNTDTVFCLSLDSGGVLWTRSYPSDLDPNLYEGGPNATPTVDGNRVYTLGKFGDLFCFDAATGGIRWQTNLTDDLGILKPTWGFAGSPLVVGEKLILNAGGHGLALNKTNGSLAWLSNTNRCGYSSPVLYTQSNTQAVVMFSQRAVVAARVDSGQLLWSHFWATQFDMNIADIVMFNGDFFLTSYGRSATLLSVIDGNTAAVWQNQNLNTILSPGVLIGNHLYAFHETQDTPDEGELRCIDMTTGNIAWATNMWVGSLISADNKLIILTGNGELVLAESSPAAYVELARAQILQGRCWTMPALSGGRLYCRNANGDVVALNLSPSTTTPPGLQVALAGAPNRIRLSWPTNAQSFRLEGVDRLAPGSVWSEPGASPVVEGNLYVLEADAVGSARLYRLRQP